MASWEHKHINLIVLDNSLLKDSRYGRQERQIKWATYIDPSGFGERPLTSAELKVTAERRLYAHRLVHRDAEENEGDEHQLRPLGPEPVGECGGEEEVGGRDAENAEV